MTLLEHIEKYLEWKSTHTSRAYINYRPWLIRFARSVGNKALEDITLDDVVAYQKHLDTKYQPYTIQLAMVSLHNFMKFWNLQKVDCISPSLIRVPRTQPRQRPVVLAEDYEKMLQTFTPSSALLDLRDELAMRFLWETGIRVSELCAINLVDLDQVKRECLVQTRKSDRMRQIFWTPETNALLSKYIEMREALSSHPALFIGLSLRRTPGRITSRTVQRFIEEIAERAQIGKKITPHSFRHGKAHKILRMGGNIKHVSAVLGHSATNPMAAMHYLHLNDIELKGVAKRFLKEEVIQ